MSSWQEPIDLKVGRLPIVRATGDAATYELRILGGVMAHELFTPTPRTRLVIRCEPSGDISVRIAEGRTSGL